MAISEFDFKNIGIITGAKKAPQFTVVYGKGGIGKSSLACYSPNAVIAAVGRETGHERMEVPKLENVNNIDPLVFTFGCIEYLISEKHSRETLVIDNAGTFRECVDEDVLVKNPKTSGGKDAKDATSLADYGYGKGMAMAYPYWTKLLAGIDRLMKKRNMHVILLAHPVMFNVNMEDGSYFQRIGINVPAGENTNVRGLLEARAHNVFYMTEEIPTGTVKGAMGGDKIIAKSTESKRIIYTKPQGNFFAKSRVNANKFYEIEKSGTEEELLKSRTNSSIIEFWNDIYN